MANPYVENVLSIAKKLLSRMPKIGGFRKFKIVGPGGGNRKDQIVVYLRDKQAQSAVIEQLEKLKHLFRPMCRWL